MPNQAKGHHAQPKQQLKQTPTSELNTLLQKYGVCAKYDVRKMNHGQEDSNRREKARKVEELLQRGRLHEMCYNRFGTQKLQLVQDLGPQITYEATLQVGQHIFHGLGGTKPEARHSAAQKALELIQSPNNPFAMFFREKLHKSSTDLSISKVYEVANQLGKSVEFSEGDHNHGSPNLPLFKSTCKVYNSRDHTGDCIVAHGEGNSKKGAKRQASVNMLKVMSDYGLLPSQYSSPSEPVVHPTKPTNNQQQQPNEVKIKYDDFYDQMKMLDIRAEGDPGKVVALLFNIVVHLKLSGPEFVTKKLDGSDQIYLDYCAAFPMTTEHLTMVECTIKFHQTIPSARKCCLTGVAYSPNVHVAEYVAAYLCLQQLGFHVDNFACTPEFDRSYQFSLAKNASFELAQMFSEADFEDAVDGQQQSTVEVTESIQQNCRFVLHILNKHYTQYYRYKQSFPITNILNKLPFAFKQFNWNSTEDVEAPEQLIVTKSKAKQLKNLVASMDDDTKKWSHLQLLAKLTSMADSLDSSELETKCLSFQCHFIEVQTNPKQYIAIMKATCGPMLSATTKNGKLLVTNFLNFGIDNTPEGAQEIASNLILKNLAYNATKQTIANDCDTVAANKKSRSKISTGCSLMKECSTLLFDICKKLGVQINFYKEQLTTDHISLQALAELRKKHQLDSIESLKLARYQINFRREIRGDVVTVTFNYLGMGNSTYSSRAVASCFALLALGMSASSEVIASLFKQLPLVVDFFVHSVPLNPRVVIDFSPRDIVNMTMVADDQQLFADHEMELTDNVVHLCDLLANYTFLLHGKHSLADMNHLPGKIEEDLTKYYNYHKQLMDNSGEFDQHSEVVQNKVKMMLTSINHNKYWEHLKLFERFISTPASGDLSRPLPKLAVEFESVTLEGCVSNSKEEEEEEEDPSPATTSSFFSRWTPPKTSKVVVIKLNVNWSPLKESPLCKHTFMSFGISHDEDKARNWASLLAIRKLVNSRSSR